MVFSNSDTTIGRIAEGVGPGQYMTRATAGFVNSATPVVISFRIDAKVANMRIGVANTAIGNQFKLGAYDESFGIEASGAVIWNNATLATVPGYVSGDLYDVEMSFSSPNHRLRARVNGGSWSSYVNLTSPVNFGSPNVIKPAVEFGEDFGLVTILGVV